MMINVSMTSMTLGGWSSDSPSRPPTGKQRGPALYLSENTVRTTQSKTNDWLFLWFYVISCHLGSFNPTFDVIQLLQSACTRPCYSFPVTPPPSSLFIYPYLWTSLTTDNRQSRDKDKRLQPELKATDNQWEQARWQHTEFSAVKTDKNDRRTRGTGAFTFPWRNSFHQGLIRVWAESLEATSHLRDFKQQRERPTS